ncbi:stage II sporulation protein P [Lachnospiraceae bacterium OttesenSCG-928-D06]|nr:stage II sporulation protein P [Lachnospiraceae bacterium OttesenSCG-928-D06]
MIKECLQVKIRKNLTGLIFFVISVFFLLFAIFKDRQDENTASMGTLFSADLAKYCEQQLLQIFVPVFGFALADEIDGSQIIAQSQMNQIMPLYGYMNNQMNEAALVEDRMTIEMILLAEANDEHNVTPKEEEENSPETNNLLELLREENEAAQQAIEEELSNQMGESIIEENIVEEPEILPGTFLPHTKQNEVNIESFRVYDDFVSAFYTIDKNTMIGSDQLNVDLFESKDLTLTKEGGGPQILIYHTHSQESFADSIPGDTSTSIVGVGEYLAEILRNEYGYEVLHHTGEYDKESRNDAYSLALPVVEQILAENPSIQVVIDLHRDAMPETTRLVTEIDGRKTAQFMFFNGLSRTKQTGNIPYLYNANLDANLAFSYKMQKKAVEYYPGLTRKIYLKSYRYNMHLCERTLLVELGAQNNTVEEAKNACDPLAHMLHMVLSEK